MANQIGALSFDIFQGFIQHAAEGVQILDRIGRPIQRSRTIGAKARESFVRTLQFEANLVAASVLPWTTYPNMKGTTVTVVDSLGVLATNILVLDVVVETFKAVIQGGGTKYLVEATWTLLAGEQAV